MTAERPPILPKYCPIVRRWVDENDVVWEEVDEQVALAMTFVRVEAGVAIAEDLGAYCRVHDEVTQTWNPAAQQAFHALLSRAITAAS